MAIWNINQAELELDITDAGVMERYENAMNALSQDIPHNISGITFSKYIRAYCKAHRNLYDKIFGKNASKKIFVGIPDSIQKYNAVFAKLLAFVAEQSKIVQDEMREIQETYAPKSDTENNENLQ